MKFTVRTKLIAFSLFFVTVIMVNVTYFFTFRELRSKRHAVEQQMERIARNIATMQLVGRQNWSDYQDYISRLMAVNDDVVYIAVYDERNWLRAHTLNSRLVEVGATSLSPREQARVVRRLDQGSIAEQSRNDLSAQNVDILIGDRILGSVHVGFSLIAINDELRARIIRNIWVGLLFILAMAMLSVFLSRRLTRPLEQLSLAMSALADGDFEQKVQIQNKDEIGNLALTFNQMVEGLRERDIIEKLGQEMANTFQLQQLSNLIRNRLKGAIGADEAKLYLVNRNEAFTFQEMSAENGHSEATFPLKCDLQTQSYLLEQTGGFPLETSPQNVQQAFQCIRPGARALVIPMAVKNELFGLLIFSMQRDDQTFTRKQRHFAATLASQATFALDNAILYEELRDQERIKRELEIAREVQQKLLPSEMPSVDGFQLDAICLPAQEVGGDYFDFFPITKDQLGIVIADVSGKGTSASFYMAEMKGMMSSLTSIYKSPKSLLVQLNQRLYDSLEKKVFATMIYGVLHIKSGKFTFARAGHNSLLRKPCQGSGEFLTPPGIGLGLDPGNEFEESLSEETVALEHGDTLLLYTDGITESMNQKRDIFGEERLLDVIEKAGLASPLELKEKIFNEVNAFSNGAYQHDDLTMVVLQKSHL